MKDVSLGDIVILHQTDEDQPAIVVRVQSPTQVQLTVFSVGGSGGSWQVYEKGSEPGQWEPKEK